MLEKKDVDFRRTGTLSSHIWPLGRQRVNEKPWQWQKTSLFVSLLQSMAQKWNKIRLVCSTIESFENTALCKFKKRLSRTFAFYLCELNSPEFFFSCYYIRNDTLLHSTSFASISDIPRCVFSP